ncbi:fimbrial protein [Photorhabdus australis]|uniref:fimbrial protein n=1 Tax=Photorhabdus australis TaxID=286156 RepID=UPI0005610CF8|nr:fimbrial protein [Photorhabdus australis]
MRKNFIWASLVMISGTFSSFSALSHDGTIKFNGKIIDSTCTVDSNGNKNEFDFGHIFTSVLNGETGKSSELKEFTISFVKCPTSVSAFNIQFDAGTTNTDSSDNTNYFATTLKNVAIAMYKSDGTTEIKPGTKVNNININSGSGNYTIKAHLISTGNTVTAGNFTSNVNITTDYP